METFPREGRSKRSAKTERHLILSVAVTPPQFTNSLLKAAQLIDLLALQRASTVASKRYLMRKKRKKRRERSQRRRET